MTIFGYKYFAIKLLRSNMNLDFLRVPFTFLGLMFDSDRRESHNSGMKRSSPTPGRRATAAICLGCMFIFVDASRADPVVWGGDPLHPANASVGILDATAIPTSTTSGIRYSDINNDNYDIVVTTSNLNRDGVDLFEGQPTWWFEGGTRSTTSQSINYSTVEFHFYANTTLNPLLVSGVHIRLEDAESEERFRGLSYFDAAGLPVSISYNSPLITYSTGSPVYHGQDGSFDSGAHYDPTTQSGKWIDINLATTAISGFTFQTGRSLASYGSVEMKAIGNILPYVEARTSSALVAGGETYRGVSAVSPTGLGTLASLLGGTASTTTHVAMDFNLPGQPANQFLAQTGGVFSDVLTLTGNGGDKFVLQLNYDDTGLTLGQEEALLLSWFNPDPGVLAFVNAVDGNTNLPGEVNSPLGHIGAYDPLTDFHLGYYGVDPVNNQVWAVIDHNSDFATVNPVPAPEPTSAILAICGALPLLARRRRTRSGV